MGKVAIGPGSSNALSGLKSRKANIVVEDRGKFDLRGMGTEAARGGNHIMVSSGRGGGISEEGLRCTCTFYVLELAGKQSCSNIRVEKSSGQVRHRKALRFGYDGLQQSASMLHSWYPMGRLMRAKCSKSR